MPFTMRETMDGAAPFGVPRTPYRRRLLHRRLPVLAAVILVLTVMGPFGTFLDLTLAQRFLYWGGLIGLGSLVFEVLTKLAFGLVGRHPRSWRALLAGVILAVAAVETVTVSLLERSLRSYDFHSLSGIAELFVYTTVVTVLAAAVPVWLELRDRNMIGTPHAAPDERAAGGAADPALPVAGTAIPDRAIPAPPAQPPAFLARIPARLGQDLLALEMEDHYVRVHTAEGSDLILMRLRDAVSELAGVDGLQVHRSYWVAAAAVAGVERKPDGRLSLRLRNGMVVPVSRSQTAGVRAAGWSEKT